MDKELEQALKENQPKYHEKAWQDYTEQELEWWVKLFRKRADHRKDPEKRAKDLQDAKNYELMLIEKRKT